MKKITECILVISIAGFFTKFFKNMAKIIDLLFSKTGCADNWLKCLLNVSMAGVCSFSWNCVTRPKTGSVGATESKVWIGNFNLKSMKKYRPHSPQNSTVSKFFCKIRAHTWVTYQTLTGLYSTIDNLLEMFKKHKKLIFWKKFNLQKPRRILIEPP